MKAPTANAAENAEGAVSTAPAGERARERGPSRNYLFVVPVGGRSIDDDTFAIESAFADHLKAWLELVADRFDSITVAGFEMTAEDYEAGKEHLAVLSAARDRIDFVAQYRGGRNMLGFLVFDFLRGLLRLHRCVRRAGAVHASTSHDLARPFEILSLCIGRLYRRKTISVTDMDLRDDARMLHQVGRWNRRNYLMCRYVYDPIRHLQHLLVARMCSQVLFKGERLLADYGRGRPWVKQMWDPGFHAEHVVDAAALDAKVAELRSGRRPLRLLYFGRLTFYKGVQCCIEALAHAVGQVGDEVTLTIMGAGEERENLELRARELGVTGQVEFVEPVHYGEQFFARIRAHDLMLAAPLSVDTPRSTWDAIASGLPLLAFDTEFYTGLGHATGVVEVVPWPSSEALGDGILRFCRDREALADMTSRTRTVALENTQEAWLQRRRDWLEEVYRDGPGRRT